MPRYSVAEAKNTLPRLIDRALSGEEVIITRHGKPVVELAAKREFDKAGWLADLDRLATERDAGPMMPISTTDLLRQMYDETPW